MSNFRVLILGAVVLLAQPVAAAQKHVTAVKEGNLAFQQKDFKKALEEYHVAEADRPETPGIDYNIANALYQLGDFEQATERLTKALNTDDVALGAQAQYNLGNTYFRAGDFQKAIEAYKTSLDLNPDDMDAKYNLELARRMLKEQTQPEQSQEQQQEQQEQQQDQQQQEQDEQEQNQQQQQQNQQEDENQKREQQQQQQPQNQKEMSKEDAERILNALQDDEQDIQKKIRRNKVGTGYVGKDW